MITLAGTKAVVFENWMVIFIPTLIMGASLMLLTFGFVITLKFWCGILPVFAVIGIFYCLLIGPFMFMLPFGLNDYFQDPKNTGKL